MSGGQLTQGVGAGLLGIEIGRNKVRLALLDSEGKLVEDLVERPIAKGGGPRDPIEEESSTRTAIEAGIDRLGLNPGVPVLVGVTIGFPHCGVGSGPALRDWLADLSHELGEPIVFVGDHGVSYAPAHCVDFVRRVFEPIGVHLDRVELAPVAASRVLDSLRSGAITLGSGVAWSARILDRDVLEAFELIDGAFDEVMQVVSNGIADPVEHLEGVFVDDELCRNRGVSLGSMAPAVGVAVALHDRSRSDLLDGQLIGPGQARPDDTFGMVENQPAPVPAPAPAYERDQPPRAQSGRQSGPLWSGTEQSGMERSVSERSGSEPSVHQPEFIDARYGDVRDRPDELPMPGVDYVGDDTTYKLRRPPDVPRNRMPGDVEAERWAPAGRQGRDDRARIESFSPQPTSFESSNGFHVSDFILGALLMLAVVMVVALIFL